MRTSRSNSLARRAGAPILAAVLALGTLAHPTVARAEDPVVSPHGKGITGGALLGAEVVTITESLAGAHQGWEYLLGAGLGAAAGGVGGYFVEHNDSSDGKIPAYMLAGGLGLIIPALVLTLNATRYMPAETATEDKAPANAPAANPGVPGGSSGTPTQGTTAPAATPAPSTTGPATTPAPSTTAPKPAGGGTAPPLSLIDVRAGAMRMGVPVPEVRPVFSTADVRQLGISQQTEVRMPIVKVTF